MSEPILSLQNPRVKELVKLRDSARRRRQLSRFPVEGLRELQAGLEADLLFLESYFCPEFFRRAGETDLLARLEGAGADLVELGPDAFRKAAYRQSPDGLLAVAATRSLDLDEIDLSAAEPPLVLVLDEVEKPGNLGAVLRTASAFGADGLLLSDPALDFFNPNVTRSSRGLSLGFPVGLGSKEQVHAFLRENGLRLFGTSAKRGIPLREADLAQPAALLLGSEREGLGSFWQERLDQALTIPMPGSADSLNLAAAAACLTYEAAAQRAAAGSP